MIKLLYVFLIIFIFLFANYLLYLLFEYLKDIVEDRFGILDKKTDFINYTLTIIHISILLTILLTIIAYGFIK